MIDCAAVAQAWEEWKMERAMEETFKKPRDFWILLKGSPYRPQVYTAVDLGDNGLENLRAQEEVVRGVLIQVGWLIQNKHGLWFGVNFSAEKNFDDLGEA